MRMLFIISVFNFILCDAYITAIRTDYGDSVKVVEYHKNGKERTEGLKINKFRHGKWMYYDEKGFLVKVEKYKNGRKVKKWLKIRL